jgi:predicted GNAT family acetyltransferase
MRIRQAREVAFALATGTSPVFNAIRRRFADARRRKLSNRAEVAAGKLEEHVGKVGKAVPMEISVVDNPEANHFELRVDGEVAGFLTYERIGDTVWFTEMSTDPDRAGQGLGLLLVRRALDAVSAERLSVLPKYRFVRDFIQRHPVYLDLVPSDQRERFDLPRDTQ